MQLNKVLGNIESYEGTASIEWIDLEWEELNKRILRKVTDQGREIAIVLEEQGLQYGDILHENEGCLIAVRTLPEEAIVIRPNGMKEMGKAAFELGNRHTPCVIERGEIVVRFDPTLELLLREIGVGYERTERRFKQPFKYKGHHH